MFDVECRKVPQRYFLGLRFDDIWEVDMKYDILDLVIKLSNSCNIGKILRKYDILLWLIFRESSIALWNKVVYDSMALNQNKEMAINH